MPERAGGVLRRREHANRQFVHICATERATKTTSPVAGEPDVTDFTTNLVAQPCYFYTVSSVEERLETGPVFTSRKGKVQFPIGADIEAGDRITIIVDQLGEQRNTNKLSIDGAPMILSTHMEVEVTEIGRV